MAEKQLSKMNEQERFDMSVRIHEVAMRLLADQMGMKNPQITITYQGKEIKRC